MKTSHRNVDVIKKLFKEKKFLFVLLFDVIYDWPMTGQAM